MAKRDRLPDQEKVRDRLKRLLSDKGIRQVQLATLSGIQNSKLSNIFNQKDELSRTDVAKLEKTTGVRSAWLEEGIEPMYHPGGKAPARPQPLKQGEQLKLYVQQHGGPTELAKRLGVTAATVVGYYSTANLSEATKEAIAKAYDITIDELFRVSYTTPKPIDYISSGVLPNRQLFVTEDMVRISRIPVVARDTFDFEQFLSNLNEEEGSVTIPHQFIRRPALHAIIEVNGDDMQSSLPAGHEVLAYVMEATDWPYAKNIVVIEYRDQFVIKRVYDNGLLTTGLLTLSSDNPTAGGVFRIPREEIRRMWQVVRSLGGPL